MWTHEDEMYLPDGNPAREIMTLLVRVHNRPIAMAKVRFPPKADIPLLGVPRLALDVRLWRKADAMNLAQAEPPSPA